MILFTIHDLFTMNVIWWEWEKNPKYNKTKKRNQGKDFPRLVALLSPCLRSGGRLFASVRKYRKQAEPTLGGRGTQAEWVKKQYRVGYNMHQFVFGQKRKVFSMNEIRTEPPFPCDYETSRNGFCKYVMTSTPESERVFKSHKLHSKN